MGLPENHSIGNKEITPNITLTVWVKSLRGNPKERGLDTVFQIFDTVSNTKICLLKEWGLAKPDRVAAWENLSLAVIGVTPVCDDDVNKLKCSGKAIVNSKTIYQWELINKYLVIESNGTAAYTSVISKN